MSKTGKRIEKLYKSLEVDKTYALDNAVQLVKENAIAKFNLAVDEAKSAGYVDDSQSKQLKDLGANGDAVGVDKLLKQIEASKK